MVRSAMSSDNVFMHHVLSCCLFANICPDLYIVTGLDQSAGSSLVAQVTRSCQTYWYEFQHVSLALSVVVSASFSTGCFCGYEYHGRCWFCIVNETFTVLEHSFPPVLPFFECYIKINEAVISAQLHQDWVIWQPLFDFACLRNSCFGQRQNKVNIHVSRAIPLQETPEALWWSGLLGTTEIWLSSLHSRNVQQARRVADPERECLASSQRLQQVSRKARGSSRAIILQKKTLKNRLTACALPMQLLLQS